MLGSLTDSGHGDHEEVDAVPVAKALLVGEVRRVTAVFELKVMIVIMEM